MVPITSTVPNMNKNNPCFSEMSHQIHKMYETVTIITQSWQRAKCYFTVPNMIEQNHHIQLWDITTNTQNLWKQYHHYSNWAQSQILFYMHQQPLLPDHHHSTQYEENPSSHHGGKHKDWLMDRLTNWRTGNFLLYTPILVRRCGK